MKAKTDVGTVMEDGMRMVRKRMWGIWLGLLLPALMLTRLMQRAEAGPSPGSDLTLDIIFTGPMTFMQYDDGDVYALMPMVKGHTYVYAKALNGCEFKTGSYQFSLPAQAQTTIDPASVVPAELKVDAKQESIQLDQAKIFVSVDLGKPYQVIPFHLDPATVWKQNPASATEHFYPTGMVVRYIVPATSLANDKLSLVPGCDLDLQPLGFERVVEIGMGPLIEDNCKHKHAHEAFDALKASIKLDRSIDFPPPPRCPNPRRFRAIDCRAPMVLVLNATRAAAPAKGGT